MVTHLCGVPIVLSLLCVRTQNISISTASVLILLGNVSEILVSSCFGAHGGQQ